MDTLVAKWWNGTWGRLARRDVELHQGGRTWRVVARQGGADGQAKHWDYANEDDARAMVRRCIETSPGDWRELPTARQPPRD